MDNPTDTPATTLPATITIEAPYEPEESPGAAIATIGAIILFAVGVLFIIFGPEKIYYNISEGLSFIQYFQAYPGPIATVGGLLVGLGSWLEKQPVTDFNERVDTAVQTQVNLDVIDIPEGQELTLDLVKPGTYTVFLRPIVEEDSETSPST